VRLDHLVSRTVLVTVTTVLLVTGCGSTPEPPPPASVTNLDASPDAAAPVSQAVFNVAGKPVVNAAEVLAAAETHWLAEKADDSERVPADGRCYFAATATGTLHTQVARQRAKTVVCGPVGPESDWEGAVLEDPVDQGGSVMLVFGDPRWTDPNAPAGFTLQRPDGKVPAEGSVASLPTA
jgi:hypothetical protein